MQNTVDRGSFDELIKKYGLGNSISSLVELRITKGIEYFDLDIAKKLMGSIFLFENGIILKFWEPTRKKEKAEQYFFASFYLLKSMEFTEGYKIRVQLKENIQIAYDTNEEDLRQDKFTQFESQYKNALDEFFN